MKKTITAPEGFTRMPWRNGLGETIELAKKLTADGAEQDEHAFLWRLSMASVQEDGEFSDFAAYQRVLVLLEGSGMSLTHANGQMDVLDKPLSMAEFSGEAGTYACLHDGSITDFNIMTLKGSCSAEVLTTSEPAAFYCELKGHCCCVYAVAEELRISVDETPLCLLPSGHLLQYRSDSMLGDSMKVMGGAAIIVQFFY